MESFGQIPLNPPFSKGEAGVGSIRIEKIDSLPGEGELIVIRSFGAKPGDR
jgi:hypothetical protein